MAWRNKHRLLELVPEVIFPAGSLGASTGSYSAARYIPGITMGLFFSKALPSAIRQLDPETSPQSFLEHISSVSIWPVILSIHQAMIAALAHSGYVDPDLHQKWGSCLYHYLSLISTL